MTEDEFNRKFRGVNCPNCRGAKQPPFDPAAVNESRFADELRFKEYGFSFHEGTGNDDDIVQVRWVTQDWNKDGLFGFLEEVVRCMRHIGFRGIVLTVMYRRGSSPTARGCSLKASSVIRKEDTNA